VFGAAGYRAGWLERLRARNRELELTLESREPVRRPARARERRLEISVPASPE
jgi:hypothetical protein